jgi:hypothetical protein
MRKILSIMVVAVVSIVTMLPSVVLAADDTVTGQFVTAQNIPTVTVKLYNAAGSAEVTSMTPATAYTVRVNVTDADGLADLNTITLKLWYDADGGAPTESEFNTAVAHVQNGLIITWTQGGTFVLTGPTSTTWALGSSSAPSSLPGDFDFKFTVGKVATETTGSANWQIEAEVLDDTPNATFAYDADTGTNDMNWYGEIAVTGATASWGTLAAGQDFAEGDPDEENVGNITYITNGVYNKKVSTASTWSTTATLDEDGASLAANSFSLKADDSGTLTSAVFVTVAGATIGSGTITAELGASDATNGLWIKLASAFSGGTFSGTITYTISQ